MMRIEFPTKAMPWLRIALFGLLATLVVSADDEDGGGDGGGSGGGGGDGGNTAAAVAAGLDVTTWADQPPAGNSLQLTLTNSSGQLNPIQYIIVPITGNRKVTKSDTVNNTVHIDGNMIAADQSNFQQLTQSDIIAYLSCDQPLSGSDTFITANTMLNTLISNEVKAIVMYSQAKNGCLLGHTDSLQYWNILSMTDAGDAQQVLGYLNATQNNMMERVSIVGNASTLDQGSPSGSSGRKSTSAVAMSILYSITGLITLLFLIIIATGAIRAHRYPERYGPRGAAAGRPRQSRAKGLARAVLDTIPIVKFNNQQPPGKPDPELELDTATIDCRDAVSTRRTASYMGEDGEPEVTPAILGDRGASLEPGAESQQDVDGRRSGETCLGCPICTEDFKVGEDMRVLPCNHLFHPNCIDPWLINVSGTCPLCRLDLNAEAHNPNDGSNAATRSSAFSPPLVLEVHDEITSSASHRLGFLRFFDINRLRHASAEEQMAALRQMRRNETAQGLRETEAGAGAGADADADAELDGEERGQRARLTAKLKDKFRIRTRARSLDRRHCD